MLDLVKGAQSEVPKKSFVLSQWRDSMEKFVNDIAKTTGAVAPFVVMIGDPKPAGDTYVATYMDVQMFMDDPEKKQIFGIVMQDIVENLRGFASIFVAEAWAKTLDGVDADKAREEVAKAGGVSGLEDKDEIVLIVYQSKTKRDVQIKKIVRDDKENILRLDSRTDINSSFYDFGPHMTWFEDPTPVAQA